MAAVLRLILEVARAQNHLAAVSGAVAAQRNGAGRVAYKAEPFYAQQG